MKIEFGFKIWLRIGEKENDTVDKYTDESWRRLRNIVRSRDHSECFYCGKITSRGHVDHKVPLSRGGTDNLDNLVWSCPTCNLDKRDMSAEEYISQRNLELEEDDIFTYLSPGDARALLTGIDDGSIRLSIRGIARNVAALGQLRAANLLHAMETVGYLEYPEESHNHPDGATLTKAGREWLEIMAQA